MKFEILGFNQELLTRNFPTLRTDDVLLLSYIYQAVASPTMQHIMQGGVPYVWLSHTKIHEDLPILAFSEDTLKRRLKQLVELGLLAVVKDYQSTHKHGCKAFYAITTACENLRFANTSEQITSGTDATSSAITSGTDATSSTVRSGKNPTSNNTLIDIHKKLVKDRDICQEVVNLYHEKCGNLPAVRVLTDKRRKAILTILKKHPIPVIQEAFEKANASDFCTGRVNGWKADLDFIMREDKFVNILEGRYDSKRKTDARMFEGGNIQSNYDRATKQKFREDIANGNATEF